MSNESLAAVNHWRGQCLDNFARVELSVVEIIEAWIAKAPTTAPALAQTASHRTRNLAQNLRKHFPNDPLAKRLASALDHWKYREAERNELVHGCFKIRDRGSNWVLINQLVLVKDQTAIRSEKMQTSGQAKAALESIIDERKLIVETINTLKVGQF